MVNLEDVSDAIVSVCVAVSCLHMGMYTAQRWRAQVGVGCFVGGRGRTLPEDGSALVWPFYAVLMPCLAIPCHPCLCPCAFHSMHSTLPSTCINLPVSSVVGSGHRWRPTPVVVVRAPDSQVVSAQRGGVGSIPLLLGAGVAHLVLCGLRLALVCLQAGDYPPDSTGLERRPSRVVGDTAVLVVVPPPYLQKIKKNKKS